MHMNPQYLLTMIISVLQRLHVRQLWLSMVILSMAMTEVISAVMEWVLLGHITVDYLLTGMVASVLVASLVVAIILYSSEQTRRVAANLAESENKYHTLFETANDGIFLQDATGFLDCNQKGASMYGLTKEEVIGRSPADLCSERQPDGRLSSEVAAEKIAAAMRGEKPCFEWQPLRADGVPFDVEVTLSFVEYRGAPCLLSIVRDISNRKEAEKAQRISERRFRHISSISNDLIYSCCRSEDGLFRVDWMGGNAQGIFGLDTKELENIACWRSFVVPEDIPLFATNITGLNRVNKATLFYALHIVMDRCITFAVLRKLKMIRMDMLATGFMVRYRTSPSASSWRPNYAKWPSPIFSPACPTGVTSWPA